MDAAVNLKSFLQRKGYRITPQRMAVLDAIVRNENKLLSAREIHAVVQKQYPGLLGVSTVYKNLRILVREGLVNKLDLLDNTGHYEMSLDDAHCHLFCLECGSISGTEEEFIQHICDLLKKENSFTVFKNDL